MNNLQEIEIVFNDLIEQLSLIKDLNEISNNYKQSTDILLRKLGDFYLNAKEKDDRVVRLLDESFSKIRKSSDILNDRLNKSILITNQLDQMLENRDTAFSNMILNFNKELATQVDSIVSDKLKVIKEDNVKNLNQVLEANKNNISQITNSINEIYYKLNSSVKENNTEMNLRISDLKDIINNLNKELRISIKAIDTRLDNVEASLQLISNQMIDFKEDISHKIDLVISNRLIKLEKDNKMIKSTNLIILISILVSIILNLILL